MSPPIDPLDKIIPNKECWRVKVRIIRLWCLPSFNNKDITNSIEMVFMDESGSTVHASVRKTLVYKFKPLLEEGQVYVIAYFGVGENGGFFRTSRHHYRLNFQFRTTVRLAESDLIPLFGCKFVPFDDILQSSSDFPYLVDVIGVLTALGTEREYVKDGQTTKMNVIELHVDSVKLEVALFGGFVDQLNSYIANNETKQTIIVIQYAKIKSFKGKIVLQNAMYGTRLLFNPDIPEVLELRNRLPVSDEDSSQGLSIISESPRYSLEDDFIKATPPKTIEELKDCKHPGLYAVLAIINCVANGPDWWYTACKCNKAVHPDSGMYYCERCNCHVVNVIPRYRIKLRVVDCSDSATFVVWDRDGTMLLKKSCSQLLDSLKNGGGPVSHPSEFDDCLIQKELLFKVDLKALLKSEFEPSYRVVRVCADESVITKFKQIANMNLTNEPDMTAGLSLGDTSLSIDFQDVESSLCKDVVNLSSEPEFFESSQGQNSETLFTPIKRPFEEVDAVLDGVLSTTKIKKESED